MSAHSIKEFSNPLAKSAMNSVTKMCKIKKYESLETNSTIDDIPFGEEGKFIMSYTSDLIFRKKVDILMK